MKRVQYTLGFTVAVTLLMAFAWYGPSSSAEEAADGKALFETAKCNMCHSVPAAGIEAKVKSEKMQGPDLDGVEVDAEMLAKYLRKETEVDGKLHKKEFTGTDEELQTLVGWVLKQKS